LICLKRKQKNLPKKVFLYSTEIEIWLRGPDLNQRPLGYEPNELPDCSTPR
jgi:membrane-bound lytic murein transglycosylase A